jgi:hypothetical protein
MKISLSKKLPSKFIEKHFTTTSKVGSVLYFPSKKLTFINHEKHGRVCPLYLADNDYNRKNNPKKIMPVIIGFTTLNAFFMLTGYGFIPMTEFYRTFYYNEYLFYISFAINALGLRKYFHYLANYTNRVKSMYLKSGGESVVLETFDGSVHKFNNLEIYDRKVFSKFETNPTRDSVWTNNENSFFARISWGTNMENIFQGKRVYLNYEVFRYVIHRYKIDTSGVRFVDKPLGFWTAEEKKKVLARYRYKNRFVLKRINLNEMGLYYYLLKYRNSRRKKLQKDVLFN